MRPHTALAFLALAACSGRTEPGPIGAPLELRQYLPDSLRTATSTTVDSTYRRLIRVGPDSARVELSWTAYEHGSGRFLGTIAGRLLDRAPYDSLALRDLSNLKNEGSKLVQVEGARMRVAWFKKGIFGHRTGAVNFWFNAGGRSIVGVPDMP